MTADMMNFRDLVEKAPDADLLREMFGFAADRLALRRLNGPSSDYCVPASTGRPSSRHSGKPP